MDELEYRIAKIRLEPGDILVLKAEGRIMVEHAKRMKDDLARLVPGTQVLILDDGMSLAILTRAEIEARL